MRNFTLKFGTSELRVGLIRLEIKGFKEWAWPGLPSAQF